jgi:hypothetical protein
MRFSIMQKLFFHLNECGASVLDEEGVEVGDLSQARLRALREARQIMSADVAAGKLCLDCHIFVTDDRGATLLVVPFREALEIRGS